jgi:hypothetical protein
MFNFFGGGFPGFEDDFHGMHGHGHGAPRKEVDTNKLYEALGVEKTRMLPLSKRLIERWQ